MEYIKNRRKKRRFLADENFKKITLKMDKYLRKVLVNDELYFVFTNMPSMTGYLNVCLNGTGGYFDVCLSNAKYAYSGKVNLCDIEKMGLLVGMKNEEYYSLMRKCLCSDGEEPSFQFTYQMTENDDSSFQFIWKQIIDDDMKFQLGSMTLWKEDDPCHKTLDIFEILSQQLNSLRAEVTNLSHRNRNLESEVKGMTERLSGYVDVKENLEKELYTKFSLVLNEKKARIRELKSKNEQVKDKEGNSSSSDSNIDTDEEKEVENKKRKSKGHCSATPLDIVLDDNLTESVDDVPKKNRKRVRTNKIAIPSHSLLPRTTSLPRPAKQETRKITARDSHVASEDDLLDELMK